MYRFNTVVKSDVYKIKEVNATMEYKEKNFFMSFMQKKSRRKSKDIAAEAAAFAERLMDLGLSSFYNKESKQRLALFRMIDDEGQGWITFSEFYSTLRYAQIFNMLSRSVYPSRLYTDDLKSNSESIV